MGKLLSGGDLNRMFVCRMDIITESMFGFQEASRHNFFLINHWHKLKKELSLKCVKITNGEACDVFEPVAD